MALSLGTVGDMLQGRVMREPTRADTFDSGPQKAKKKKIKKKNSIIK